MFRKLVSNLAFSPALINEVSFYAKRLKQEEVTRKLTVLFTVLALIMQSLAVFSPPESANASSEQDIIRGGVSSLDDFLLRYDHNEEDVKDIYSAAGITRSEIMNAKPVTIYPQDNIYIMSRYGQLASSQKEVSISYARSVGGMGIRYFSPLIDITSARSGLDGWTGTSATLGWFAIVRSNGALATKGIPTSINPSNAATSTTFNTISGFNLSQNKPVTDTSPAESLDKISYTLRVTNSGNTSVTAPISVRIADVLEYSKLIDGGGGTYQETNSTLSWPQVQLASHQSQERTFVIQLASSIPSTSVGKSNPASYDCKLSITFGTTLTSPVDCGGPKVIENILALLPPTSTSTNVIFALVLFGIVSFFYIRTRQLRKEIRIIRHNFNTGIM